MEDKKTQKKAFIKMLLFKIFILIGYLLTFFVLLFVVSRCSKDVSADVPQYYEMTYNSNDIIDINTGNNVTIKVDFFSLQDLLVDTSNIVIQKYDFTYNNNTCYCEFKSRNINNSGFNLDVNIYGYNLSWTSHTIFNWITSRQIENKVLAIGVMLYYNYNISNNLRLEPVFYLLDTEDINNSVWYDLEPYRVTLPFSSCNIVSHSINQFWVTSRFATDLTLGDTTEDYTKLLSLIRSTNVNNINVVYRNEYLFGDLVSSFLNISFGNVVLGGTTYTFTLGLLLLFILGLGALFLVLKVLLGG